MVITRFHHSISPLSQVSFFHIFVLISRKNYHHQMKCSYFGNHWWLHKHILAHSCGLFANSPSRQVAVALKLHIIHNPKMWLNISAVITSGAHVPNQLQFLERQYTYDSTECRFVCHWWSKCWASVVVFGAKTRLTAECFRSPKFTKSNESKLVN